MRKKGLVFGLGIVLTLLLVLLSSCEADVSINLTLSKVVDVASKKVTKSEVTGKITFDVTDKETFEKNKAQIKSVLSQYFILTGDIVYKEKDYSSFGVVNVKIPVVNKQDVGKTNSIFEIYASQSQNTVACGLYWNSKLFNRMNQKLEEINYAATIDISDVEITLTVSNDTSKSYTASFTSVYVEGTPVPFTEDFKLNAGSDYEVKFPDILVEYLGNGKTKEFLVLK